MSYESKKYYLQDSRTLVGNSMVWWCHHGKGYTCDIRKAGIYSEEELKDYIDRDTDIPWPVEQINRVIQFHIDIQDVRKDVIKTSPHTMGDWTI